MEGERAEEAHETPYHQSGIDVFYRRARNFATASAMAFTIGCGDVSPPTASAVSGGGGGTAAALETAITTLESASDRQQTVQALADVFEAAGSKTLLARTKYKYVS